jgi:hypothetical protein
MPDRTRVRRAQANLREISFNQPAFSAILAIAVMVAPLNRREVPLTHRHEREPEAHRHG